MLIRFHGKAGGFTIQADVGTELLRLMGMTGDVPGALLARDIPPALERLKRAVSKSPAAAADAQEQSSRVSLSARAYPLVQLLEAAARRNCDVVWEEQGKSTG